MRRLLLLIIFFSFPSLAWSDLFVIVNTANPSTTMTEEQVSALYLGRTYSFPQGGFAQVFDHPRESTIRENFFAKLVGMPIKSVNTYWTRLTFAGQAVPPAPLPDDSSVLEMVRKNPAAIGYVSTLPKDAGVRVVLHVK